VIGSDCVVGHNAHLEGCVVEDRCLIGSGSITLNRARVGAGSIVGAAALIGEDFVVPPASLAVGVPATIKRTGVRDDWTAVAVKKYMDTARLHREHLRLLSD
jgi:carbonic anhydrase/acetyltransferase-like protein (isoleucine patch superfamily)